MSRYRRADTIKVGDTIITDVDLAHTVRFIEITTDTVFLRTTIGTVTTDPDTMLLVIG